MISYNFEDIKCDICNLKLNLPSMVKENLKLVPIIEPRNLKNSNYALFEIFSSNGNILKIIFIDITINKNLRVDDFFFKAKKGDIYLKNKINKDSINFISFNGIEVKNKSSLILENNFFYVKINVFNNIEKNMKNFESFITNPAYNFNIDHNKNKNSYSLNDINKNKYYIKKKLKNKFCISLEIIEEREEH